MAEKNIRARIVHKHDIAANWNKATSFIPKQGEIIVYDIDNDYNYERFKIGDGITNVNSLPFADNALREAIITQINNVDDKVGAVSALVGDTAVSEQIAAANIIYVGPDMPTDSNIKVWINTAEEGTGIVPVLPRIATITLSASAWTGSSAPYSQVVTINTVTSATKVELNPTVAQIVSLQSEDIALTAENNNGVVTVYSFGGKPSTDMIMQVTLQEVAYV
jgi:hypothetical protein